MNLRHLLEAIRREGGELEVGAELGALDLEILHVTDRLAEAGPHSLLVVPRMPLGDVGPYVPTAGWQAAALIVEKPVEAAVPVIRVRNARRAMGLALGVLHRYPTDHLLATAFTGFRGKSLTAVIAGAILSRADLTTGLLSSVMMSTGEAVSGVAGSLDPAEQYRALAKMAETPLTAALVELEPSETAVDLSAGLSFDLVVWAGSGPEPPCDSLFPELKPHARTLSLARPDSSESSPETSLIVGGAKADFRVEPAGENAWTLQARPGLPALQGGVVDDSVVTIRPPGPGRAYLAASQLAASVALLHGVRPRAIESALSLFPGVHRHFQNVYDGHFKVIDDCPGDPVALCQTLEDLAQLTTHRLIPVVSVYGGFGPDRNRAIANALARMLPALNVTNLIAVECREDAPPWAIVTAAERSAFVLGCHGDGLTLEYYPYLDTGLRRALALAREGDVIALIGGETLRLGQQVLDQVLRAHPFLLDRDLFDELEREPLLKPLETLS